MSAIDYAIQTCQFHRSRTLGLLEQIEKLPDPQAALAWRPGPGRAHIAWHLMHIGVTEELFASERLAQKAGAFTELWPRFRGGSTPDDSVPSPKEIRRVLDESRAHLVQTFGELAPDSLDDFPQHWKERGLPVRTVLQLIPWHEAHHQGQAHCVLNLFKVAHAG